MTDEPSQPESPPEDLGTWNPPADARVIAAVESTFKAKTLLAVLADHDINAAAVPHVQQGASIHPAGANYPVRLVVGPDDADRARQVLDDNARDAAAINWDDVAMDEIDIAPPPHRVPIVIRLGLYTAIAIIVLMIVMAVLMLLL